MWFAVVWDGLRWFGMVCGNSMDRDQNGWNQPERPETISRTTETDLNHCRMQVALSALTCRFSPFALWDLADFG